MNREHQPGKFITSSLRLTDTSSKSWPRSSLTDAVLVPVISLSTDDHVKIRIRPTVKCYVTPIGNRGRDNH